MSKEYEPCDEASFDFPLLFFQIPCNLKVKIETKLLLCLTERRQA